MSNSFSLSFYNKEDAIDQERERVFSVQRYRKSGQSVVVSAVHRKVKVSVCAWTNKCKKEADRGRQSQARSTLSELFAFVQCSMRGKERRTSEERDWPGTKEGSGKSSGYP